MSIYTSAVIAFLPLLWLLVSLGVLKMPAHKATVMGLAASAVIAVLIWSMPVNLMFKAALEGIVMAFWPILWVILAAIFTYNVSVETGAMDKMRDQIASLSDDRRIQALLIAWGFGAFLEAAAGFGTAVAIPAAILIGLGFEPLAAAVLCLIANTVPVAFGAVGIPVTTLAQVADLPVMELTYAIALQLTPFVIVIPAGLILLMTRNVAGLKGVMGAALVAGISFAIPQLLIAKYVGPQLTAIGASIVSMAATALWAKYFPPDKIWHFPFEAAKEIKESKAGVRAADNQTFFDQAAAWAPYLLILLFILVTSPLVPAVNAAFAHIKSYILIYNGPGGKPLAIDWLLTPGTLIVIAAIIGGFIQGASAAGLVKIFYKTLINLKKTSVTIISIVALAKIMSYSGMVAAIALALAKVTGSAYPILAPALGALGTFVTGSDTSANVLFGPLQKQTALQIGVDPTWIAASNTTGATAGKMISPQSIAIATTATGQSGKEGQILAITFKYCLGYVIVAGLLVYFFA